MLIDAHGRSIDYLRLAVTDRCNLRCVYCMPESGIEFLPKTHLLTYEELERLTRIFVSLGINKVRVTGGEPFARRNMFDFLAKLSAIHGLNGLHLTTNGTLTRPHLAELDAIGLAGLNLSLDTLDEDRFFALTRRKMLPVVLETMNAALALGLRVKINMVVMGGRNHIDILPMSQLAKNRQLEVRFIEEMPFNGTGQRLGQQAWSEKEIFQLLAGYYPGIQKRALGVGQTAQRFDVPGFKGSLGIIAAYSRTFCGQCNRARITPDGRLKTCLYDVEGVDMRGPLRAGADDATISRLICGAFARKARDGFEAEARKVQSLPVLASMAQIGG